MVIAALCNFGFSYGRVLPVEGETADYRNTPLIQIL
jgi:hypothetical protein